jgi:hypothetical protein
VLETIHTGLQLEPLLKKIINSGSQLGPLMKNIINIGSQLEQPLKVLKSISGGFSEKPVFIIVFL